MLRAAPDLIGPWEKARLECVRSGWQAAGQAERLHAQPACAGEGGRVQCGAAQMTGTDRADMVQESHRMDHLKVERDLAHLPAQALEHLRQRLLPPAHSHGV